VRAGLTKEAASQSIGDLVERRLLVADERGGVRRVELAHDVLTAIASASRAHRREREAGERAAAAQRERLHRQRRIALTVVVILLLGCGGLVAYAYRTRQEVKFRELLDAGNFLLEKADYQTARERFKEAASLRASRAEAWFGLGDSLVRQAYGAGDARNTPILLDAIEAYRKAVDIEKNKNAPSTQYDTGLARLAQAYVGLGDVHALGADPDFAKAQAFYQQAETIDPGSPDPHVGYGNIHLEEGHFRSAMEQYSIGLKEARQRNTPNYGAHVGLGAAYFNLGHYRLAMEEFNRAIGANPGAVIARFRLAGAVYMNDPADPRAVELFRDLLGSNMKRLDSLTEMNLAYMRLEKPNAPPAEFSEAFKNLEDAFTKDPYAFSAFRLGIGRALQDKAGEASNLWKEASTLGWGSDSLSRRIYSPFLAALLDDPAALAQFQQVAGSLANEGALGFLANVKRDAELIRRSGLFAKQIEPLIAALDSAIAIAAEHNKIPESEPAASK
jgi:tetratricopeptide (TPR) repeat protein